MLILCQSFRIDFVQSQKNNGMRVSSSLQRGQNTIALFICELPIISAHLVLLGFGEVTVLDASFQRVPVNSSFRSIMSQEICSTGDHKLPSIPLSASCKKSCYP